jgi:hypothetical protein
MTFGKNGRNVTATSSLPYMSDRVEACRRKASECELAARLASDIEMRIMYRDLARLWQEMASELEQHDQALLAPQRSK